MMEEIEKAAKEIKERRVMVQVPEGLKPLIPEIVDILERHGKEVVVNIDPIFGACDVRIREMEASGAEAILHVGHVPMIKHPRVYYVEWRREVDLERVRMAVEGLVEKGEVCFATTANFRWVVEEVKKLGVLVGKGSWRVPYEGVVLGCDTSACDVEAEINIFLGDGHFHPMAIWINTRRPTYVVSPLGEVREVSYENILKKRLALIGSLEGKRVGIVISSKVGQNRRELAFQLKRLAEREGYIANLYVSDYLEPLYLLGLPDDFFVYTGCPRVPVDDAERYEKPVLTPEEFLLKLGILKEYRIGWITKVPL